MKYVLKNIRSFAKDYTRIFILLIITIAASTLIIHLSYGVFREYKDRKELSRNGTKQIVLRLKRWKDCKRREKSRGTDGGINHP